ncbi:MAG: hypothetical protein IPG11_04300 [Flavobacteriales bacterium]|nr:hypothetical protein [Flavobacteriales bacterium]
MVFSPLIRIFTRPLGDSLAFAKKQQTDEQQGNGKEYRKRNEDGRTHDQILMPMNAMKAMPMSPVRIKVMPKPRSGAGTSL